MAYFDTTWYLHAGDGATTGYYAVPVWAASQAVTVGMLRRQLAAPAVGSERVFVCIVPGNTGTAEPVWVITRGGKSPTDGTAAWMEVTGQTAVNGDLANTPNWTNASLGLKNITQGQIVANTAGTFYFVVFTTGTTASPEPTWSTTLGSTTGSGTCTFECIGPVSAFPPWSAPHARFGNATAANWGASGNDFNAADNSAETSAAAITCNAGTVALPCRVFSIDHTAAMPPSPASLKPGASFTSSLAAASSLVINSAGSAYWYGITWIATGTSNNSFHTIVGNGAQGKFEACSFQLGAGAGATSSILVGPGGQFEGYADFVSCTWGFSNVAQTVFWSGGFHSWRNTPDPCILGTIPTTFMRFFANAPAAVLFEGVDLTSLGANTLLSGAFGGGNLTLKNCKLHSGPLNSAITTAAALVLNLDVTACDSGALTYRNERHNIYGDLTTSPLVVRTGGASDGVTAVSHTIVPSAYVRSWRPFHCLPLMIWNDVVGVSRTVTIYGGALAFPGVQNNQFWIEVEYMGSSATPNASVASSGLATQLSAPAYYAGGTPDTSSWDSAAPVRQNSHAYLLNDVIRVASAPGMVFVCTTAGTSAASEPAYSAVQDGQFIIDGTARMTSLFRFAASVTITPLQRGYITVYPKVGAQMSLFIDPLVVLS